MFKKKYDTHKENQSDEVEMVLLKATNDKYELGLIKSVLDERGIPYVVKDHGIGGYMRIISGDSLYGTDILVEKSIFERAKAILDEFPWEDVE